ncbi:hypothetical protein AVEN_78791-1, partial [Araneus ventricosus]
SAVSGSLDRLDSFLNLDGVVKVRVMDSIIVEWDRLMLNTKSEKINKKIALLMRIRNDAIVVDNQVGSIDILRYMVTNFIEHGVEHPRIS